ncbi:MAG: O-antigen ligase family protein [Thermoflexales bacterium]
MKRVVIAHGLDRLAALALIALAAILPFEIIRPVFSMANPGLALTNVEAVAYAALALGGLAWLASAPSDRSLAAWRPMGAGAIAAIVAVLGLSALFAREPRPDAARFAIRAILAAGLAFVAARAVRRPWVRPALVMALGAGGLASAALGAIETLFPAFQSELWPFRAQSFTLAGYPRAMGSFQYPTIAAMFWEASVPLAVVGLSRLPRAPVWVGLACLVFGVALAGSLGRAAIALTGAGLVALAGLSPRLNRAAAPEALAGLAGYVLGAGAVLISSPALSARLNAETDTALNRARVSVVSGVPAQIAAGGVFSLTLDLVNQGIETWPAAGPRAISVSYHWIDGSRTRHAVFDGLRSPLPADLAPGASARLDARIMAPDAPGDYVLQIDLQRLDGAWFTQKGNPMPEQRMSISGPAVAASVPPTQAGVSTFVPPEEQGEVGRLDLWRIAVRMFAESPVLGAGPDNFRHLYGPYLGRRVFNTAIHANSLYFESLASLGGLGLAAVLGLAVSVARGWRRLMKSGARPADGFQTAGVLIAISTFFAHGLLDYFLPFTPTYALFWLLFGCAAMIPGPKDGPR